MGGMRRRRHTTAKQEFFQLKMSNKLCRRPAAPLCAACGRRCQLKPKLAQCLHRAPLDPQNAHLRALNNECPRLRTARKCAHSCAAARSNRAHSFDAGQLLRKQRGERRLERNVRQFIAAGGFRCFVSHSRPQTFISFSATRCASNAHAAGVAVGMRTNPPPSAFTIYFGCNSLTFRPTKLLHCHRM